MIKYLSLIPLVAAALFFTGCKHKDGGEASGTGIRIGEYGSMTGSEATFGLSTDKGIMLAVDQINASGGVLGKQIKIIPYDDAGKQDEVTTVVKRLIDQDNVAAILGEVASSNSLVGGSVCQPAHVPMISPSSTNPDVTKLGDYIFRTCYTDDFAGAVNANFAVKRGWKKIAILTCVDSDYSNGLTKYFKKSIAGRAEIVGDESYNHDDVDFTAQLTRIQSESPDAVYLPGYYTNIVQIMKQARGKLGMKMPFFGSDGWDSDETLKLGALANDCFFTNHYSPDEDRPEVKAFISAFKAKYNGETPDAMAITGYDAALVLADAIKRAGKVDRTAIRDAIADTTNFHGATGAITIDSNRNCRKPIVIVEIRDGKTHLVETIAPELEHGPTTRPQ